MNILDGLEYKETRRFSKTAEDYLAGSTYLSQFLPSFPYSEAKLIESAKNRIAQFSKEKRLCLTDSLTRQYATFNSNQIKKSIELLAKEDTVCVTTGHQLCIFGGPLYFIYKIAGAIKLARNLRKKGLRVVPVFWMASEDHDFEEISKTSIFGKEIVWETNQKGAVGRMFLDDDFEKTLLQVESILGDSEKAKALREILRSAYKIGATLSEATRKYVHLLFGDEELLVLDADDIELKAQFSSIVRQELTSQKVDSSIQATLKAMKEKELKIQVNPRKINLFYLDRERSRISSRDNSFETVDGRKEWTAAELIVETAKHPERFSPNVLLRPIYQELIIPNIAYIGGGAELAYWMELKTSFDAFDVSYPYVLLRNSAQLLSKSILKRWEKLGLDLSDIFSSKLELESKILELSNVHFSIEEEFEQIQKAFAQLEAKALSIDAGLKGQLGAEHVKINKQLRNLEARIRRSAKQKEEIKLNQLNTLTEKFFPRGSLQERKDNVLEFLLQDGNLIPHLIESLDPLHPKFILAELE